MIRHFNKPYKIAFVLTILLMILVIIIQVELRNSQVSFQNFYTSFFEIYYFDLKIIVPFYGLIILIYLIFKNQNLNIWLTRIHLLCSFILIIPIIYLFDFIRIINIAARKNDFEGFEFLGYAMVDVIAEMSFHILLFGQFLLLINIIKSYIKPIKF